MSESYGQFGSKCVDTCCDAGLLDLYCPTFEIGRYTSHYCFTKTCSVGTREFQSNGWQIDQLHSVPYGGSKPRRRVVQSKAAWENNTVFQFEISMNEVFDLFSFRHFQPSAVVPLAQQWPSPEVSSVVVADSVVSNGYTGSDVLSPSSLYAVTHSGAFEARSNKDVISGSTDMVYLPLFGIVSTDDDSLATIQTAHSDGEVSCGQICVTEDFEAAGIVFRFQNTDNYLIALVEKTPSPLFSIKSVVGGTTTTLTSTAITDARVFDVGNYNKEIIGNPVNSSGATDYGFELTILLNGPSITATLFRRINFFGPDPSENENYTEVLSTSTSDLVDNTRVGIYAGNAEVAFRDCRLTINHITTNQKEFISIYDDSVPERLEEFDITDDVGGDVKPFPYTSGVLIAGGDSGIFAHSYLTNEEPEPNDLPPGPSSSTPNDGAFLSTYRIDPDTDVLILPLVEEFKREIGDTWSKTTHESTGTLIEYDKDELAAAQFETYEMVLGYQAVPVFAQHSYPRCAGWRMVNVSWEDDTVTVEHQIIAGNVVWSPDGLSLPYVDDTDPVILYSYEEEIDGSAWMVTDATEDWVRYNVSLIKQFGPWLLPLGRFEADPDLTAVVLSWGPNYYSRLGKYGIVRLDPDIGSPTVFDFNDYNGGWPFDGWAVAAPGGRAAVLEQTWDPGEEPPFDPPNNHRFTIYGPSGTGDPWVRFQYESSLTPTDYPLFIQATNGGTRQTFFPLCCSDSYVYVLGPTMSQPEACAFAGHSLPAIDRNLPFTNWNSEKHFAWLISWDGEVKIPAIGKGRFEPEYSARDSSSLMFGALGRVEQPYDCIKDSSLPFAPSFTLSAEQTVAFTHDYNNDFYYDGGGGGGGHADPKGLGAFTWTCPAGCTEVDVEAWGAGGGGSTNYDYRGLFDTIPADLFTSAGGTTWTCPSDVTGIYVAAVGAGGDSDSDHGAGGGALAMSFIDVVPDQVYDVFVAAGGSTDLTYFDTEDRVSAQPGESASGANGAGGGIFQRGAGHFRELGNPGTASTFGGGTGQLPGFHDGWLEPPVGNGGHKGNNPGEPGGVQITYWPTLSGQGGGGGGGYARKTLAVTAGSDYDGWIGHPGYGQRGLIDDPPGAFFILPLHAEDSWFVDTSTLVARGGRSAGSDSADSQEAIATGAGGGGGPETDPNIGDVTFVGGDGGNGNTASQYFPGIGGGGGGAGGPTSDGNDGANGRDGGYGGASVNDLNIYQAGRWLRQGSGGTGNTAGRQGTVWDTAFFVFPGGGGGGDMFDPLQGTSSGVFPPPGGAGRVLIRGFCTGRLIIPEF